MSPEDTAMLVLQPGAGEDVLVFQSAGGSMRRLKFPAGQPPAESKALFDALMRIERRSEARARVVSSG